MMLYRTLLRVPVFGEVLRIFNTYAYVGDVRADSEFAGVKKWTLSYGTQCTIAVIGALLCTPAILNCWLAKTAYTMTYSITVPPGTLATGILPNVLGFGIGVYGLIFGLHHLVLRQLQEGFKSTQTNGKATHGSVLLVNADMAVPLIIILLTIVIGVVHQIAAPRQWLDVLTWAFLWLSFLFTLELIVTLFGLGENVILKKLETDA
jgi:hypothetical protein